MPGSLRFTIHPKETNTMAIVLEANYAKKLGLPGYSSHQYSVSIRTELTDLSQVEAESARLYRLLQDSVDLSIQTVGFMPDAQTYGAVPGHVANDRAVNGSRGAGHAPPPPNSNSWRCSPKQSELIQKIVRENGFEKTEVEQIALDMFGIGVRQLNRLQASGLIDELFQRANSNSPKSPEAPAPSNGNQRPNMAVLARRVRSVTQPVLGGVAA